MASLAPLVREQRDGVRNEVDHLRPGEHSLEAGRVEFGSKVEREPNEGGESASGTVQDTFVARATAPGTVLAPVDLSTELPRSDPEASTRDRDIDTNVPGSVPELRNASQNPEGPNLHRGESMWRDRAQTDVGLRFVESESAHESSYAERIVPSSSPVEGHRVGLPDEVSNTELQHFDSERLPSGFYVNRDSGGVGATQTDFHTDDSPRAEYARADTPRTRETLDRAESYDADIIASGEALSSPRYVYIDSPLGRVSSETESATRGDQTSEAPAAVEVSDGPPSLASPNARLRAPSWFGYLNVLPEIQARIRSLLATSDITFEEAQDRAIREFLREHADRLGLDRGRLDAFLTLRAEGPRTPRRSPTPTSSSSS
jgi:hypothetical protein